LSLLQYAVCGASGPEVAGKGTRCRVRAAHVVYWFITRALVSLGMMELLGLELILFPVGLVLLAIGLRALRGREVHVGILGFAAAREAVYVSAFVVRHFQFPTPFALWDTVAWGVIIIFWVVALLVRWRAPQRNV
jgi:hypothetical protein